VQESSNIGQKAAKQATKETCC